MKKLVWPETQHDQVYKCKVCERIVLCEINHDSDNNLWFTPASKYWNVKRNEVYCSAQHSLERHQQCG